MKNEMDIGLSITEFGNYKAKKYCKDNCTQKVIYEFPERIFVYFEVHNENITQSIDGILDTLQITKKSEYINVEDHQLGYKLTLPSDKTYQTSTETVGPFEGVHQKGD